jgi:hypothetical protein
MDNDIPSRGRNRSSNNPFLTPGGIDYSGNSPFGSGEYVEDAGGVNRRERWGGASYLGTPQEGWLTRMHGQARGLENAGVGQDGFGRAYLDFLESTGATHGTFDIELGMNKPLFALSLMDTQPFRDIQNYQQYTDVMGTYGVGAGQIGQAAQQGAVSAQNQMARMGLGRSASSAAIQGNAQMQAMSQQALMRNNLARQQMQLRQQGAQNAYNALQGITAMALGYDMKSTQDLPHRPLKDWQIWGLQLQDQYMPNFNLGFGGGG